MELAVIITASIVVGLIVGTLSGMLGIGGGTLLIPIFKLGYGLSALASTATSLFTIIPTSISGAVTHIKNRTCLPRLGLAAGIGGALTSPMGVWLANISPDWATMVAAALVILYSACTMFRKARNLQHKQSKAIHHANTAFDAKQPILPHIGGKQVVLGVCIGLFAGVLSGYVGVGGGFIMVPLFMQMLKMPMRLTSGTSLIAVMMIAVPGTITQAVLGNVNWMAGCFVALGAIPGAALGSILTKHVPELALRYIFSVFLLVAAIMLMLDQLKIL